MNKNQANLWLWSVWGVKYNSYSSYMKMIESWTDEQLFQYIKSTDQMVEYVRDVSDKCRFNVRKIVEDDYIWERFDAWVNKNEERMERWNSDQHDSVLYEHMWTIKQQGIIHTHFDLYIDYQLHAAKRILVERMTNGVDIFVDEVENPVVEYMEAIRKGSDHDQKW